MNETEKRYHQTVKHIGFCMLIFFGLFLLYSTLLELLGAITDKIPSLIAGEVIYEICYGIGYAAVFMVPVAFFRRFTKNAHREPMHLELTLSRDTGLYIVVGLALITAAAFVNSMLVSVFHYDSFMEQFTPVVSANYQIVLQFFTIAVVPAFVEEFLFRGVVLSNLLPYGRTHAIIFSSLLFALMHQNVGQFFYTAVAGLFLGYIYVKTGSIWGSVLLHFVNNFYSVFQTVLTERLPESVATVTIYAIQAVIFTGAVLCAVVLLLRRQSGPDDVRRTGVFERDVPPAPDYTDYPMPMARRVRLFFAAPMLTFVILCCVEMLALLALSFLPLPF